MMGDYTSPAYEQNNVVSSFLKVPRFGHTEDFTSLISGDNNEGDYISGLLFIPCFVWAVTLLWVVLLVVFKLCLPKTFLGGKKHGQGEGKWVKLTFLVLALSFLITTILFGLFGVRSFNSTVDNLDENRINFFSKVNAGFEALSNTIYVTQNVTDAVPEVIDGLVDLNCTSFPDILKEDLTNIVDDINVNNDFDSMISDIETFSETLIAKSKEYEEDTKDIVNSLRSVLEVIVLVKLIPTLVFVSIFIIYAFLGWFDKLSSEATGFCSCMHSWFLIPLFILWMILASCIIGLSGVILVIMADVCTGGETNNPEGTVQSLLETFKPSEEVTFYANYYIIEGCRQEIPLPSINEIADDIDLRSSDLVAFVDEAQSTFSLACPNDKGLGDVLSNFSSDVLTMTESLNQTIAAIECESINEEFVKITHGNICNDTTNSLQWIYVTTLILWIFGMLMVSLRSALYF